jgi:hypothetical protein
MRRGVIATITLEVMCLAAFFGLACAAPKSPDVTVKITAPEQAAEVVRETIVAGTVSDPKARVYVLVHPLRVKPWWVQRVPAPANNDGSWQTLCYFGEAGRGLNEQYQIIAIVTDRTFSEGDQLDDVPSDVAHSEVVTVKRTQ